MGAFDNSDVPFTLWHVDSLDDYFLPVYYIDAFLWSSETQA
jgi:hypothetical protein